ncbi:MFS transporter [Agaribacterium haliotis]|uniref:MFS transporter n=1 Tax=Agaribacterium haliotis TaxID=2013869 RepID=UPI0023D86D04|nr:MFS transporter [Agaribacterium haliotis]
MVRMLGLFMVLPVMFIYGQDYCGASATTLGLALGIYGLSQALLQIPLGLLSDLIGRKLVIVLGLLVFIIGSIVAACAESVWGLILGRALQGCGAIASTVMALLADLTTDKNRSKAMAAIGASIGFSFVLAMVLGPVLAAKGGLSTIFVVTAGLGSVALILALCLVPQVKQLNSPRRDSMAVPALFLSSFLNPALARLNVGIFVLHAVMTAVFVVVPSLLVSSLGLPAKEHWQLYLPLMLVAFVLAVALMMRAEKAGRAKFAFIGAVACLALSLFAFAFGYASTVFVLLSLSVFFVAFNLLEAMLPSLVSKMCPAGGRGTAMGIYSSSQFLGAFCGGVAGGYLFDSGAEVAVFVVAGLCVVLWLLLALPMKAPEAAHSLSYAVSNSIVDVDLLALDGVSDVIYVEDEAQLYLKVDKSRLDMSLLEQHLAAHLKA